jgi:hypothetical protein
VTPTSPSQPGAIGSAAALDAQQTKKMTVASFQALPFRDLGRPLGTQPIGIHDPTPEGAFGHMGAAAAGATLNDTSLPELAELARGQEAAVVRAEQRVDDCRLAAP